MSPTISQNGRPAHMCVIANTGERKHLGFSWGLGARAATSFLAAPATALAAACPNTKGIALPCCHSATQLRCHAAERQPHNNTHTHTHGNVFLVLFNTHTAPGSHPRRAK